MKHTIPLCALGVLALLFTGCLGPMKNEIPLAGGDLSIKATNPNETKLLVFNNSNFVLYGLDGSGRINVKLNGKGFAQFNIGDYVQAILPKGRYQFNLVHMDFVKFSSQHQIDLTNAESFLEIKATPTANQVQMLPTLPVDFETKFKIVKSSKK